MTRIVTPEEAQRLLDTPNSPQGSFDWDYSYTNTYGANFLDAGPDLAHTVIQQAEQIKRLQNAVKFLLEDFNDADQDIFSERHVGQGEFEPSTTEDYGLTEKDMKP